MAKLSKATERLIRDIASGANRVWYQGEPYGWKAAARAGLVERVGEDRAQLTDAGKAAAAKLDAPVQIVLARLVEDVEVAKPGQPDLGIRPTLRQIHRAEALVWLRSGTAADVAKAETYAASEGYTVLQYPTTERNPLERAKRDVAKTR